MQEVVSGCYKKTIETIGISEFDLSIQQSYMQESIDALLASNISNLRILKRWKQPQFGNGRKMRRISYLI